MHPMHGNTVAPGNRIEAETAQRRERRLARYQEVLALHQQQLSLRALSDRVGISRMTARKYLRAGSFPELSARKSALDPHTPHGAYLRQRWAEGGRNAAQLFRELQARGFTGSAGAVRRLVGAWREAPSRRGRPARTGIPSTRRPASQIRSPSPRQVQWLLLRSQSERSAVQELFLEHLRVRCPEVIVAEALAQQFRQMVRTRDAPALTIWLASATQSGSVEFREFALGLRRDQAAVQAALTLKWSNGQTEGVRRGTRMCISPARGWNKKGGSRVTRLTWRRKAMGTRAWRESG